MATWDDESWLTRVPKRMAQAYLDAATEPGGAPPGGV